jgi:hypothetical protein
MALSELRRALERANEIEITVTGRRSGREFSHPVWFVVEDGTLYLLPVSGSETEWYRNVLTTPTIVLAAEGAQGSAEASPLTDAAKVADVVERFRAKYGAREVENGYSKLDVAVEVPLD